MTNTLKARVFMNGESQAVEIPDEFRFRGKEVFVRRDARSGDLILSETKSWEEIFAALDEANLPDNFLTNLR